MSTDRIRPRSAGLPLAEILPIAQSIGKSNFRVRSCCGQWDECQPDDLYVALVGDDHDGHDFVDQAIQRGASAVVGERLLAIDQPQFIVNDSRQAFGEICHALAGRPSQRLGTIGISGSDGKTVTAHLIHAVLDAAGYGTGFISSITDAQQATDQPPCSDGDRRNRAEPSAARLAQQLTDMVLQGQSHAVIETSSTALAQRVCSGLELDVAVVTNVRRNRLGIHGSVPNYLRAEQRLFDCLKPTGFAVLNADDPLTRRLLDEVESPALTIGIHQQAEVTGQRISADRCGQAFLVRAGDESVVVETPIPGTQHVYNCLAATAVGLTLGIGLPTIAEGLGQARIPGRLERIDCGQPFGVWIDAAHSPNQVAAAIAAIQQITPGRLWCVASIHASQTNEDRRQIGRALEKGTDVPVISMSEMSPHVDFEPTHQVLDGFERPAHAHTIPNRFRAIEFVLSQADEDDSVLILGCGERPIARVGQHAWTVTDRDVCRAWLYDHVSWLADPDDHPPIFRIDDYRT